MTMVLGNLFRTGAWLHETASAGRTATQGSVAVVFALSITVVMGAVGLAVDYGQYVFMRQKTQTALDAAVLAASSLALASTSSELARSQESEGGDERQERFKAVFATNYPASKPQPISLRFSHTTADGGSGKAEMKMPLGFLRVLGLQDATTTLTSNAKINKLDFEIAFVLDISGSMAAGDMGAGSRMDVLKASVGKLIDTIMAAKTSSQRVRFSIVPFNMAVNIGTANSSLVANTNSPLFSGSTWGGCVLERPNGFHAKDTYSPGASDGSGKWPAYIWPPAPNSSSCLNPSNGTNSGYQSNEPLPLGKNPWSDGPNFNCPRFPLLRLTENESAVRTALNDLTPYGNMGTVVGPAVGWGMRTLSPNGAFGDGVAFSPETRKIMIVVTDGEMVTDGGSCSGGSNTSEAYKFDPKSIGLQGRVLTSGPVDDSFTPYGFLADSDPYNKSIYTRSDADKELDRLSIEACNEVKARHAGAGGIEIFTVAASAGAGPGTRAQEVLSKCASKSSNFLYAADAASLDVAFQKIGEQAFGLRLTQ